VFILVLIFNLSLFACLLEIRIHMACYLEDYSFMSYDVLIGSLVEQCVLP
jgi:hypothetical protein